MDIQTVVVEVRYVPYEVNDSFVYFLKESPEDVKKSIKLKSRSDWPLRITRTVYSLEDYIKQQTREISDFT